MLRAIAGASLTILVAAGLYGQARPAFVVASVKSSGPQARGPQITGVLQGGPGSPDPERITGTRITLQRFLREAYGVDFDQIQGPAWMADERYDIVAKVPPGATKEQLKLMLQGLLEERFKLALHLAKKDFPVYEITIAKGGLKLKEITDTLEPSLPGNPRPQADGNGFPQFAPGKSGMASSMANGLNHMTARGMPLAMLTSQLGAQLGTITGANTFAMGRIVDKTGLTGKYDFNLEYAGGPGVGAALRLPATADGEPTGGVGILDAMEKQLGLKVTKSTASYDVLVIDHVEKTPTEN
jgi:uncharacterized protein (TIGR03435 family)